MSMEMVTKIANILLIIGGLNWGLTAFNFNVVNMLLGSIPVLETIVYVLVGLSALVSIYGMTQN